MKKKNLLIFSVILLVAISFIVVSAETRTNNYNLYTSASASPTPSVSPTPKPLSNITNKTIKASIYKVIKSLLASKTTNDIRKPDYIHVNEISTSNVPNKPYVSVSTGYRGGEKANFKIYKKVGDGDWTVKYETSTETVGVSASDYNANEAGTTYSYYATAILNGIESEPTEIKSLTLNWPECSDSDYDSEHRLGLDYYEKGTHEGKTDYCVDSTRLHEYFCSASDQTFNLYYDCENGCVDGACVSTQNIIEIDSCQILDKEDTIYKLTADVESAGTCFEIKADGVTLDGQGHKISYGNSEKGYGVYVEGHDEPTIKNCEIEEGTSEINSKHAIYFENVRKGVIQDNDIIDIGWHSHGVYLIDSSFNNIKRNEINSVTEYPNGLYIGGGSSNDILDNIIIVNAGGAYSYAAVYLEGTINNIIINNNIKQKGLTAVQAALYLNDAENTIISKNNIETDTTIGGDGLEISSSSDTKINGDTINIKDGGKGIYLFDSDKTKISYTEVITSLDSGLYVYEANSATIIGSKFDSDSAKSLYFNKFIGKISLTDVDFLDKEFVDSLKGILDVYWYLDIQVKDDSSDLEGADVKAYDKDNNLVFEGKTYPGGNIEKLILLQYTQIGSSIIYSSPYTVEVSKPGYQTEERQIELDESKIEVFVLEKDNRISPLQNTIEISSCQTLDQQDTEYKLTRDVSSSGTCFEIKANNVVLDCQDHDITYGQSQNGYGIQLRGYNSPVIRNCNIVGRSKTKSHAIYSSQSIKNSLIEENTISLREFKDTADYYGIYLSGSNNNIRDNDITIQDGLEEYGIYLPNSNSNEISGNEISVGGDYCHGLYIHGSDNEVKENTISTEGDVIYLEDSTNNQIANNVLIGDGKVGSFHHGIVGLSNSNENLISGNSIKSYNSAPEGIALLGSSNNEITQNEIIIDRAYNIPDARADGMAILSDSNDNTITQNTITSDLSKGLVISGSSDNIINKNTIISERNDAIYLINSNNNELSEITAYTKTPGHPTLRVFRTNNVLIKDSKFKSQVSPDLFITRLSDGEINLMNVDFLVTYFDYMSENTLNVHWYLDIQAKDISGNLQDVNVKIFDKNNELVFDGLTDNEGKIPRQTLLEYTQTKDGKTYSTPYKIQVSKSGYETQTRQINLDENKAEVFNLQTTESSTKTITLNSKKSKSFGIIKSKDYYSSVKVEPSPTPSLTPIMLNNKIVLNKPQQESNFFSILKRIFGLA